MWTVALPWSTSCRKSFSPPVFSHKNCKYSSAFVEPLHKYDLAPCMTRIGCSFHIYISLYISNFPKKNVSIPFLWYSVDIAVSTGGKTRCDQRETNPTNNDRISDCASQCLMTARSLPELNGTKKWFNSTANGECCICQEVFLFRGEALRKEKALEMSKTKARLLHKWILFISMPTCEIRSKQLTNTFVQHCNQRPDVDFKFGDRILELFWLSVRNIRKSF
jgi:hypothetical protein